MEKNVLNTTKRMGKNILNLVCFFLKLFAFGAKWNGHMEIGMLYIIRTKDFIWLPWAKLANYSRRCQNVAQHHSILTYMSRHKQILLWWSTNMYAIYFKCPECCSLHVPSMHITVSQLITISIKRRASSTVREIESVCVLLFIIILSCSYSLFWCTIWWVKQARTPKLDSLLH